MIVYSIHLNLSKSEALAPPPPPPPCRLLHTTAYLLKIHELKRETRGEKGGLKVNVTGKNRMQKRAAVSFKMCIKRRLPFVRLANELELWRQRIKRTNGKL